MDDEPVPQGGGAALVKDIALVVVLGLKVLPSLFFGHKGGAGHVGNGLDLTLQGLALFSGQAVVDVGQKFVVLFQVAEDVVSVHGDEGEGAHDEQTGHRHAHGGEGHQPMGKDTPEPLPDMIPDLSISHCRNTPLPRR